jgi:hypothetical protein
LRSSTQNERISTQKLFFSWKPVNYCLLRGINQKPMKKQFKPNFVRLALLVFIFSQLIHPAFSQEEDDEVCGASWRWSIKTATDDDGLDILEGKPINTTFTKLIQLTRPDKVGVSTRFPDEMKLVKFKAKLIKHKYIGGEGDKDFHIVIQDPNSKKQMIIEIPNPECGAFKGHPGVRESIESSRENYIDNFGEPRTAMKDVEGHPMVEIVGIPFWDKSGHGTGHSLNGLEIHPVISVETLEENKMAAVDLAADDNESSNTNLNSGNMAPMTPVDMLALILLGAILGMVGQGLRIAVGLKKVNEQAAASNKPLGEIFDIKKMILSLLCAAVIGSICGVLFAIDYIGKPIDKTTVLAIITAGYAGTDFIEGFISKNLK